MGTFSTNVIFDEMSLRHILYNMLAPQNDYRYAILLLYVSSLKHSFKFNFVHFFGPENSHVK